MCCTGRDIERLVGHIVPVFLLKRELLSVLCSVYTLISQSYLRPQPPWRNVRGELQMCWDLLPVIAAELDAEGSPVVHAHLASLSGFGVYRPRGRHGGRPRRRPHGAGALPRAPRPSHRR